MDERERAMSILIRARELLANRLIDSILEADEKILEDAEGCSYMDEIERLQEQVGGRLNSINTMIANLAAGKPSGQGPAKDAAEGTHSSVEAGETEQTDPPQRANFALFAEQIAANDLEGAGQTLSELLEVDPTLALQCATSFRDRLNEDPTTIQKAMRLRIELMAGNNNDSLMILWDCFRLQGPQAVEVLQRLKARLAAA